MTATYPTTITVEEIDDRPGQYLGSCIYEPVAVFTRRVDAWCRPYWIASHYYDHTAIGTTFRSLEDAARFVRAWFFEGVDEAN